MTIRVLPEEVASKIAAGEVVERPESVVKELIENSLDAEATGISVEVERGGRRRIRVADDGVGIPPDEIELAFARYATSKLTSAGDLDHITTLGFRGEALASIAAVSRVTLLSRTRDSEIGARIRLEGGRVIEKVPAGAPVGTTVTVEDLFFNTPARLKFLKSERTERRRIEGLVSRYAMAYPHVRFRLSLEGREVFRSTGSGDAADVMIEVFGLDRFRQMIELGPVEVETEGSGIIRVRGYIGAPSLHHANRTHITLFVNGRHIRDAGLTYAVSQAYHTLLPHDRYPVAVVMIELPPEDVDVNVHPTKAEVRFRRPNEVFSALRRVIREALLAESPIASATPEPSGWVPPGRTPVHTEPRPVQTRMPLPTPAPGRRTYQATPHAPSGEPDERPRSLPILRVVGQVGAMYIVAEGPVGMYLIDQHAAHERVLFERFMAEYRAGGMVGQRVLDGVVVELSRERASILQENLDVLAAMGFGIEPFGRATFKITAIPAIFSDEAPERILDAILDDLEGGDEPGELALEERIAARACKQAAIKAGQVLSFDEMQELVRQLEYCANPLTCPHGRPTLIHISSDQLAREFGRR